MSKVNFCKLTADQYASLESKDADTIYFLTDSKVVILGTNKFIHENKADKFLVQRVFAHDVYGTVAYLDANNTMDLSGYFAEGIETFTVPVSGSVAKVTINPAESPCGIVSIGRDTASEADTLNDGTDAITALVVDWRCW